MTSMWNLDVRLNAVNSSVLFNLYEDLNKILWKLYLDFNFNNKFPGGWYEFGKFLGKNHRVPLHPCSVFRPCGMKEFKSSSGLHFLLDLTAEEFFNECFHSFARFRKTFRISFNLCQYLMNLTLITMFIFLLSSLVFDEHFLNTVMYHAVFDC